MSAGFSMETHYMIFDDQEGVSVRVSPNADNSDYVSILTTHCKDSVDHYGSIELSIQKEMALKIGKALIQAANNTVE